MCTNVECANVELSKLPSEVALHKSYCNGVNRAKLSLFKSAYVLDYLFLVYIYLDVLEFQLIKD